MATFPAVLLVFILIAYGVAFTRKGHLNMAMPSNKRELRSPAAPDIVLERIRQLAPPYVVEAHGDGVVVLSSPVTFGSWGFFYPVRVVADGTGSRIFIGITSKIFQIGPLVTRAHTKCERAIESALSIPQARVA